MATNLELKVALKELAARVDVLEAEVKVLRKVPTGAETRLVESPIKEGRAMCPKCGKKPNHYFHVKHCPG